MDNTDLLKMPIWQITGEQFLQLLELSETINGKQKSNFQQSEYIDADKWFNIQELREYLPDRPARQTVYGWVGQRFIPYHKKGSKLQFLKADIDAWLKIDRVKTALELQTETLQFVKSKKRRS